MMQVKRFVSSYLSSNMYVIKKRGRAIIIDPSKFDDDVLNYIRDLKVDYILLTHEHYDHIAYLNQIKQFTGAPAIGTVACAKGVNSSKKNLSKYFKILEELTPFAELKANTLIDTNYVSELDESFEHDLGLKWQGYSVRMVATPGHSPGSACIVFDEDYLFSGDSLIGGYDVITKLPGGSKTQYKNHALKLINTLQCDMKVFPGHLDSFILSDIKPR